MSSVFDTVVIGGGQAGLAAGYWLQRAGFHFTIVEAGAQAAGSWPYYYDTLKLFSTARLSGLPGLPFPAENEHYPDRDAVARYLTTYAAHFGLPVVANTRVAGVTRDVRFFTLATTNGPQFQTQTLIAATGSFGRPYIPSLPGQATFRGRLLHAADYRNSAPFQGQRVIVVGGGNSGVQIAAELVGVARVTLATRSPIRLVPQRVYGQDFFYWLSVLGTERLPLGYLGRLSEPQVVIDSGGYRAMLKGRTLDWRPMFTAFTSDGVVWPSGHAEAVDAVIFATGYRPNLGYLQALGALDTYGEPLQRAGVSLTTPGLYYIGLPGQRTFVSATLRGVGPDAAYVVSRLGQYLLQSRESRPR